MATSLDNSEGHSTTTRIETFSRAIFLTKSLTIIQKDIPPQQGLKHLARHVA